MNKKGFTYTLQIDAEINDLIAKTNQVKKSMQSIVDAGKAPGAEKIFGSIEKAIEKLQSKVSQPITSIAAFENLQKDAAAVGASLNKLNSIVEDLGKMSAVDKMKLLPPDLKKQIEAASSALVSFTNARDQASQKTEKLVEAEKDLAEAQKDLKKAEGRVTEKKALVEAQKQLVDSARAETAAIKDKVEALKKYQSTLAAYEAAGGDKRKTGGGKDELEGLNLPADRRAAANAVPGLNLKDAEAINAAISRLNEEYSQMGKTITDVENTQRKYTKQLNEANNASTVASSKVESLKKAVKDFNKEFEENKVKEIGSAYAQLRVEAQKLGIDLSQIPVEYTKQGFNDLNAALDRLAQEGLVQVNAGLDVIQTEMDETNNSAKNFGDQMSIAGNEVTKLDARVSNTTAFAERIKQFVGLAGGIEIARNAMRNAFSTIKELDAAMTEMAVVTDLGVGDYWKQLPEYTARAKELGLAIGDVYKADTLFYQQGLKTNEVVEISTQTMKMAAIAGIDTALATDRMTAALRGFNMELNETSAQRVSDVYSELAAITAADVGEISNAMTKTASIASSAGMEFETTAAFLSQIIETTRESAETAGTAMKTVIARFSEVKKLQNEGIMSGQDPEGEVIDVNKIQTALRTVGISMNEFFQGAEGLDSVFLRLAEKWDTLDVKTQRYIATVAAGSRQQSRFIAMMSDYGRTQELVTAANTSAGASQKQFEKTTESLGYKLNNLKAAWDSFTMDIMNSDALKQGVDLLTKILTTVNNVSDLFGDFSGAAKILALVSALYLGDKAITAFMASIKNGNTIFQSLGAAATGAFKGVISDATKLKNALDGIAAKAQITRDHLSVMNNPVQKAATDDYTNALQRNAKAIETLSKLEQQGIQSGAEYARAKATQVQSNLDMESSLYRISNAFNLSEKEMRDYLLLTQSGVGADKAAILVKNEKAMAILREQAALDSLNDEKAQEQLLNKVEDLTKGSEQVDTFTNSIDSLAKKLQNFNLTEWFSNLGPKLKAVGEGFLNAAKSVLKFLGSIWPLLILLAALTAAIIGLVVYIKHLQKTSPEGKLKAAKKATEEAGKAAEQAADAYNGLVNSLNSLDDKYKGLEELTRGTKEWREAVRAVNDEVLDLITEYPQLAGMFENVDGVLTIKAGMEDDVDSVLNQKEAEMMQTKSAEIAAKIATAQAENDVKYEGLSDEAKYGIQNLERWALWGGAGAGATGGAIGGAVGGAALGSIAPGIGTAIGGVLGGVIGGLAGGIGGGIAAHAGISAIQAENKAEDKDYTEIIAKAMASGQIANPMDKDEVAKFIAEEFNMSIEAANKWAEQLSGSAEELIEFGRSLNLAEEQTKMYYESMAQNAAQMVNTSGMTEEQMKQISIAATDGYGKAFNDSEAKSFKEKNNKEQKEILKQYAQSLGYTDASVSMDGNTIKYKDAEGQEQKVSREVFEKQYLAAKATEKMTAGLQQLPKTIDKISAQMTSTAGKAFKAMYAGKEGSAMTKADIEASREVTQGQLVTIWNNLAEEEKKAYGSFEQLQKQYNDSVAAGNEALKQAQEASVKAGIEVMDGITMETARGYAEQMRYVYTLNEQSVQSLQKELSDVTATLNDTDKTNLISTLNQLDWQSVESLDSFAEILEEMGINVPEDELNEYVELLKESAGAVKNIDLEKIREAASELTNIKKNISSGDQGRSFSEESFNALKEMVPDLADQFQKSLDGQYVYLGSSMDTLTQAIENNTTALLSEATKDLNNKIVMSELVNMITADVDGVKYDFNKLNEANSEDAQRAALKALQQNMRLNGAEITGIQGFGNYTPVDKLSGDELDNIIAQLVSSAGGLESYKQELRKTVAEATTDIYQGNSAIQNAYGAQRLGEQYSSYQEMDKGAQQEFNARANALITQATQTGVSSTLVNDYAKVIEAYKSGDKAYSEVLKVQKQLANSNDFLNMRKGLNEVISSISEVKDEYEQVGSDDMASKIMIANQALSQFGIVLDENANPDKYMEMLEAVTQGSTEAMAMLVQYAQDAAVESERLPEGLENAYSEGWVNISQEQIDFYDQMAAASLGYWQMLEDGSRQFVWATIAQLEELEEETEEIEAWENPYTWLYNYNEEINRLIREREKSEREYTRALEDETTSAKELLDISKKQLDTLSAEAEMYSAGAQKALKEIQSQFEANANFSQYVSFDAETSEILIDYAGLNTAGFDEDTGKEFEEFLSAIEENRDVILEAEEALYDIEDQIKEIKDRGKQETSDLYDGIKEGLVISRQEEIDKMQTINDSIKEAADALCNQIQQQIDEARQARENEKIERDIADKEILLGYLMRDTSGANATEIASLQQEITEDKQGYTDSLVDQQLQSIQDANEKAAEQRQQQIDIAQGQLDAYANSEAIWLEVESILYSSLLQAQASENFAEGWQKSQAMEYLKIANNIDSLNPISKEQMAEELTNNAKLGALYAGIAALETATAAKAAEDVQNGKIDDVKESIEAMEGTLSSAASTTTEAVNSNKTEVMSAKAEVGKLGTVSIPSGVESINLKQDAVASAIKDHTVTVEVKLQKEEPPEDDDDDDDDDYKPGLASGGVGNGGDHSGGGSTGGSVGSEVYEGQGDGFGEIKTDGTHVSVSPDNKEEKEPEPEVVEPKQTIEGGVPASMSWFNDKPNKWFDITIAGQTDEYVETGNVYSDAAELDTLYRATYGEPGKGAVVYKNDMLYVRGAEKWYQVLNQGADLDATDAPNRIREAAKGWRTRNGLGKPFRYKTGGLADFTGPAWLDGTKSKPEIVLNQTDSANFMQLRDILADILHGTSTLPKSEKANVPSGDNYFDIEINIESLNDDYDVEQLAGKIRNMIYEDSIYRNVNTVTGLR